MFEIGEAVVHPAHGAGVIVARQELRRQGNSSQYYRIELLKRTQTSLLIPVKQAEAGGIRPAVSQSELSRVWYVLRATPEALPDNHKTRHRLLEEKLQAGNIFEIAEAVRDIAWRQHESDLTDRGRQIYRKGLMLLTAELAAAQDMTLSDAEAQVEAKIREIVSLNANRVYEHNLV